MLIAVWIGEFGQLAQQQRVFEDALNWFDEEGF